MVIHEGARGWANRDHPGQGGSKKPGEGRPCPHSGILVCADVIRGWSGKESGPACERPCRSRPRTWPGASLPGPAGPAVARVQTSSEQYPVPRRHGRLVGHPWPWAGTVRELESDLSHPAHHPSARTLSRQGAPGGRRQAGMDRMKIDKAVYSPVRQPVETARGCTRAAFQQGTSSEWGDSSLPLHRWPRLHENPSDEEDGARLATSPSMSTRKDSCNMRRSLR